MILGKNSGQILKRRRERQQSAAALRVAESRGRSQGINEGTLLGERNTIERMTFEFAPPDYQSGAVRRPVLLGKQPEQPYVRILFPRGMHAIDEQRADWRMMSPRTLTASFEAIRKTWTAPDGTSVVWWDWQFEGVR